MGWHGFHVSVILITHSANALIYSHLRVISTKRWTWARKCTMHGQPCFRVSDISLWYKLSRRAETLHNIQDFTGCTWLGHPQDGYITSMCNPTITMWGRREFHHTFQAYLPDDTLVVHSPDVYNGAIVT